MSVRTQRQAIAWARHQAIGGYNEWYRYCLRFTRMCFNVAAKYPDAKTAWKATRYKHRVSKGLEVPRGVPVWWSGGTWGHVALSAGGGDCYSNDFVVRGEIHRVRIDDITEKWGYTLEGWSEDINGVRVAPQRKHAPVPKVDLSRVKKAARLDPARPQGGHTKGCRSHVRRVERALRSEGLLDAQFATDGSYGTSTHAAYAAWQRKLGYYGDDADGVPGIRSLRALGRRHGFTVS